MKSLLYKLKIPDNIAELIRTPHPHLKKKIKASLQTILSDLYSGKTLKDKISALRSFRVSKFRIVYRISEKQVEIVVIGPCREIYEETFRLICKEKENYYTGVIYVRTHHNI